jgi:spermidine/putrescine transport system permease protein
MLFIFVLLALVFLYGPIVIIGLFSFHSSPSLVFPFQGVSLRWYHDLMANDTFITSLGNSVLVATCACVVTTVLGCCATLALMRLRGTPKAMLGFLSTAPVALPGLFLGIGLVALFAQFGVERSLVTVTLAHVLYALPFFVEAMRSRIQYFDLSLEEAARDLGASGFQAFRRVTLPILGPTLAGAAILTFALSFDEFIITVFVSGNDTTLPLMIWSMMRRTVNPTINAASMVALALSIFITAAGGLVFWLQRRLVINGRSRKSRKNHDSRHRATEPRYEEVRQLHGIGQHQPERT